MKSAITTLSFALLLTLTACDGIDPSPKEEVKKEPEGVIMKHVIDDELKTMEDAKELEELLQEDVNDKLDKIDAAGG